jgi:8-hydroxy-5-deazaflavin:NADPH oxidoreductase
MTIALIGAGNVGMALARNLTAHGESVRFGVPDPAKTQSAVAAQGDAPVGRAQIGTVAEAIAAAGIVILAVPFGAAQLVAESTRDWGGRILVDATNPLAPGLAGLALGTTTSGAEQIAQWARGARVVKAFNTTGAENMANPRYPGGAVFMPVAGDDAEARARVVALATLLGFDAVDVGPLAAARYLEPFAMTWIHMAIKRGLGRDFAFGLLRR